LTRQGFPDIMNIIMHLLTNFWLPHVMPD